MSLASILAAPLRRVSEIQARPAGPTPLVRVPDVGDVVLCYVPADDKLKTPGPKAKPVIVLSTHTHTDGQISMQVCEGTINGKGLGAGSDFLLTDSVELRAAGINMPTYFNLRNRKNIMWDEKFAAIDKSFPILGTLDPKSFERLRACYGAALKTERARLDIQRAQAARQAATQQAAQPAPAKPAPERPAGLTGRQLRAQLHER